MTKLSLLPAVVFAAGFIAAPAFADTIGVSPVPINGHAGTNGMHTVMIDKASCKVKNSASVPGASAGCNYKISLSGIDEQGMGGTWTVVPEQNNGCSTKCE
ncbi:hypothetical protein CKO38_17170 [Rhodospirillum rubrum]|uniref:hypothetical protein n=1 Tax=Rhodospirillum rubrum TaxID=1085 RepID=UPI001902FF66|nr:hypothetical protein [Rhodospirillum rubrum]MBK1665498.1 hypothetical protein [Rhodospirillum rubrum]MBK1678368.1 hypothetical protein [Rhodospirillum rubrum]